MSMRQCILGCLAERQPRVSRCLGGFQTLQFCTVLLRFLLEFQLFKNQTPNLSLKWNLQALTSFTPLPLFQPRRCMATDGWQ